MVIYFLELSPFLHSDFEFRALTLTPPSLSLSLSLCFQVSLRQWGTMWPSPPPWLKAGSPTSSSGKVGPSLPTRRRFTPTSAPTATWLKERRRPGSLQVLIPVTHNDTFWILFFHNLLSLGCLAVSSLSRFSCSIISWQAPTFCHTPNPPKTPVCRRVRHAHRAVSWVTACLGSRWWPIRHSPRTLHCPPTVQRLLLFCCDSSFFWRRGHRHSLIKTEGEGEVEGERVGFIVSVHPVLTLSCIFFLASWSILQSKTLYPAFKRRTEQEKLIKYRRQLLWYSVNLVSHFLRK